MTKLFNVTCNNCKRTFLSMGGSILDCPTCGTGMPTVETAAPETDRAATGKAYAPTVPQMLNELAQIHGNRKPMYGVNYKFAGAILKALCQGPIHLRTEEDFNRFHFLVHLAGKLSRYAAMLSRGGHMDSLDDLAVYAMLAKEYDMEKGFDNDGKHTTQPGTS